MSDTLLKSRKQVRVYLAETQEERMEKLVEATGINETKIANLILDAGLEAIFRNGASITLPLVLTIDKQSPK